MSKPSFYLPRIYRDVSSNVSLCENIPNTILHGSHNASNFSYNEIENIYNLYKDYIQNIYIFEYIYNSPPHQDYYMPLLYEYYSGKYAIKLYTRIAGTPAFYPQSYTTTYTMIVSANNVKVDAGVTPPLFLAPAAADGIILTTTIILGSRKNRFLFGIGDINYSQSGIKFFIVDHQLYIALNRLSLRDNTENPNTYLNIINLNSKCYKSVNSLSSERNSLRFDVDIDRNYVNIEVMAGINNSNYQKFCSLNINTKSNDKRFYFFKNINYNSYISPGTRAYSEYTNVQGNQSITKFFDNNLTEIKETRWYAPPGFIQFSDAYQYPYGSGSTSNIIGTTDIESVGSDYTAGTIVDDSFYSSLQNIENNINESLWQMDPISGNNVSFYLPYNKGNITDPNQLDKNFVCDLLVTEKIPQLEMVKEFSVSIEVNNNISIEKDIINPITVSVPQEFPSIDLLNPIEIQIKEDVEKDLFPVTIDAAKDINPVDIDPVTISVKEDIEQDILNPITIDAALDITPVDPFEISITALDWLKSIAEIEDYINKTYLGSQQAADDFQLLFRVTDTSYWPVEYTIDTDYHIHIKPDPMYIGVELYACTNKQFLYCKYDMMNI